MKFRLAALFVLAGLHAVLRGGKPIAAAASSPVQRIALFDGQSLATWKFVSRDATIDAASIWSVKDGVIVCAGKPNGYARTTVDYRDYTLHAEWRFPAGAGNSGLFLHLNGPDKVWPVCLEVQLKSNDAGTIRVNGGALVQEVDLAAKDPKNVALRGPVSEKPLGEWNSCDVVVRGDTAVVRINGILQNEVTHASVRAGAIGLQAEGTPVEFRNLYVAPLAKP
jgi:hypothetical protein